MPLLGIIAVRNRGSNIPDNEILDAFKEIDVPLGIVSSDDVNGIKFHEIREHDVQSYPRWIELGIAAILVIEIIRLFW